MGIVAAALIDKLGIEGTLVHVHPGTSDHPTQAVLALNLPKEQLDQMISINIQRLCSNEKSEDFMPLVSSPKTDNSVSNEETLLGKRKSNAVTNIGGKLRKREESTERALKFLNNRKVDSLLIVGKEYPNNIFKKLIKHLEISRPFVVYFPVREPLQDLYCELKQRTDIIAVRLTESWLRDYQVLPDRTHPDIRISGSGGFLLSGFYVCS